MSRPGMSRLLTAMQRRGVTTGGFNRPSVEDRGRNAWETADLRQWKPDHRGVLWVTLSLGATGAVLKYWIDAKKENKGALQTAPKSTSDAPVHARAP